MAGIADSNTAASADSDGGGAGQSEVPGGGEEGDGFSDISDSELLMLQSAVESGDTLVQETDEKQKEYGNTSLHKSDVTGQSSETEHQCVTGEKGSSEDVPRKRKQQPETPLEKYHFKWLTVTDISSQVWCEQQMVYKIEQPELKTAAMKEGSSIHLARELEVHDVVPITTQTREDSWAVKFLNVLAMTPVLQSGGCVREFPVFGELDGIFVVGVIDELGYTSKGKLELKDLKTRVSPTLPSSAQKKSHELQVSLYKLLFDGMVSGVLQPELFIHHLKLRPEQELGAEVKEHAIQSGLTASTFKDILELICLNLTFSDLPMIDSLKLEYCYQRDRSLLANDVVRFDKDKVMQQVTFYLSYWKGLRDAQGVDIEDAWKCQMCAYADACDWRIQKSQNTSFINIRKKMK